MEKLNAATKFIFSHTVTRINGNLLITQLINEIVNLPGTTVYRRNNVDPQPE